MIFRPLLSNKIALNGPVGRFTWLYRAAVFAGAYATWIAALRLISLTFVTYFVMTSAPGAAPLPKFEEISETFSSSEITVMGMTSLLFVCLLRWMNPITSTNTSEIFTPQRFENHVVPGFIRGAAIATALILTFLLGGIYRYLGLFIQFEEAPLALVSIILRTATIGVFVYCEEFVFRHKILHHLRSKIPMLSSDLAAVTLTAIVYCSIKLIQFDLGIMSMFTLFLISMALGLRALYYGDFGRGAGLWAAILIVFNPLLSLPVLGSEFTGIMLVKFQPLTGPGNELESELARLLSGGSGGPLASIAFQLVLIFDVVRLIFRYKIKLKR